LSLVLWHLRWIFGSWVLETWFILFLPNKHF
jgi:hypothetical protein